MVNTLSVLHCRTVDKCNLILNSKSVYLNLCFYVGVYILYEYVPTLKGSPIVSLSEMSLCRYKHPVSAPTDRSIPL